MTSLRLLAMMAVVAVGSSDAAAQNWSGFYGGLAAGSNINGSARATTGLSIPATFSDGSIGGAFGGYNFQNGNVVYGIEAAWSAASIAPDNGSSDGFTQFSDVKLRLGYATGNALLYGVAGYSQARFGALVDTVDETGMSFGMGADVKISDRVFIGAEYLFRKLDGPLSTPPGNQLKTENAVLTLRVGMTF